MATSVAKTLNELFGADENDPIPGLVRKLGIIITEISTNRLVGTMPVYGNTQPFGLMHGGASLVLAETLGSLGAQLHAMPDRMAFGLEINATHCKSATSGVVTGIATPVHLSQSLAVHQIGIYDQNNRRICTSRMTCLLREMTRKSATKSEEGEHGIRHMESSE